MKKRITVTRNYFEFVMRSLIEVGYDALDDYEKEICDATDHDGVMIIENPVVELKAGEEPEE